MHWIENALANVNLEALNDILRWTIGLINIFELDIGSGNSIFETTIPVAAFLGPIAALAMFIVVCGVALKLYIAILSPFDSAEEPAAVMLRGAAAAVGVKLSTEIFIYAERGFNEIYKMFVSVYQDATSKYTESLFPAGSSGSGTDSGDSSWNSDKAANWWRSLWDSIKNYNSSDGRLAQDNGTAGDALTPSTSPTSSGAFNFFGGENLINPASPDYGATASLGILLLELIIGCTLMICFFRLVLEVYERYVLLGVMYITSPLAFAGIIAKNAQVFWSWFNMLISQFILMCVNLVFVGGFITAWYNIISQGLQNGYMFESYTSYVTTMFALIGWLLAGQKMDQHLKGINGMSVAQTGAGIMGALAGGVVAARSALGVAGSVGGGIYKTATGQTMAQRSWQSGKDGHPVGVPGAIANQIYGQGRGGISGSEKSVGSVNSLPQDPKSVSGDKRADIYASNKAAYDQIQQIAQRSDVQHSNGEQIANFDAATAEYVSGGDGYAVISSNGIDATVYSDFKAGAEAHPNEVKPIDIGKGKDISKGAVHFSIADAEKKIPTQKK